MKTLFQSLVMTVALLWSTGAHATGLLQSTPCSRGASTTLLSPVKMKVLATIQDQIATTVVREEFRQTDADSVKAEYGFPVPANASVSGVRLWIDGNEYVVTMSGAPVDTARNSGGGAVAKTMLQAEFARYGYNLLPFTLPITTTVKGGSSVTVEITYIELLPYTLGLSEYTFPLKTLQTDAYLTDPANSNDFFLSIVLETGATLDTAWSVTHSGVDFKKELNNLGVQLALSAKGEGTQRVRADFAMQFRVSQKNIKSAFYSCKPSKDDGHFVFLLRPDANTSTSSVLPKTFTFIIDVSGSMNGTKIRQAKEAASHCIGNLNPQDRFNVIAFSDYVRSASTMPMPATASNIAYAQRYIDNLYASGGTDIQAAAITGLSQYTDNTAVNVIIFLTDGVAPMDHTIINSANKARVRMCVFGVGSDVNSQELAKLAANNNGIAEFITETQNTASVISGFYNRIRYPLWTKVSMSVAGGGTYDVLPVLMPDLNVGEQLVVSGRYTTPGLAVITVRGTAEGRPVERIVPVIFSGDSTSDVFCPKIWARMRIEYLKNLMAKEQPNSSRWTEWRSEIVRLGLRYGIVTEFTTYKDTGTISDVEVAEATTARGMAAYPNPFSSSTSIAYTVVEPAPIRITVFDIHGNELAVLLDSFSDAGEHSILWDGRDADGNELANGVYLCSIRIGTKEHIVKLIIAR